MNHTSHPKFPVRAPYFDTIWCIQRISPSLHFGKENRLHKPNTCFTHGLQPRLHLEIVHEKMQCRPGASSRPKCGLFDFTQTYGQTCGRALTSAACCLGARQSEVCYMYRMATLAYYVHLSNRLNSPLLLYAFGRFSVRKSIETL